MKHADKVNAGGGDENVRDAVSGFAGRVFHNAARAELLSRKIEWGRKLRPAAWFSFIEGLLGVVALDSAAKKKSWLYYVMGLMLFFVACGHAFADIRNQKTLDSLEKLL